MKSLVIKFSIALFALFVVGISGMYLVYKSVKNNLPQLFSVQDYDPLSVSIVYDRTHKPFGEFFEQRRTVVQYDKIPKHLINAFLAAEDDQFFKHKGLNYQAILRAFLANLKAGHTVQGGSTITQQIAKTFFLSNEKKLYRKMQEALLAKELEEHLSKEELLYLYLNQIFLGNNAYGVEVASQTYFRKPVSQISLAESAILAGLPKAPSEYSPVVNPQGAKERQRYVLRRMAEVGFITKEDAEKAANETIKVYLRETYSDVAPYYLQTVRDLLTDKLGEEVINKKGLRIYTALDREGQKAAQLSMVEGLKELDKRQGFRGAIKRIEDPKDIESFMTKYKKKLISESTPERVILPEGKFADIKSDKLYKLNETYETLVTEVNDDFGLVYLKLPDAQGVIDFESMKWARVPNSDKSFEQDQISKPSQALKPGDVIFAKLVSEKASFSKNSQASILAAKNKPKEKLKVVSTGDLSAYLSFQLDQEPLAEGALISIDQNSQEVISIVGGYSFNRSKLIRAFQAFRQTGSSFKTIVYASALDKGFTPSSAIMDAPVVYEEDKEGQDEDAKQWKPSNHGKSFGGEIIFRNALIRSLNIPTVRILEDVGVSWAADYARRLGVFSPLNMDFSLALGSSSLSLYEMTKVFSQLGRLGKKVHPTLIHKVTDSSGKVLAENIGLDEKFQDKISKIEEEFDQRRLAFLNSKKEQTGVQGGSEGGSIQGTPSHDSLSKDTSNISEIPKQNKKPKADEFLFTEDTEQLIRPQTAYVMTSLLKGVVDDAHGTGGKARALGREVAGKTGTSNGYVDAWFIGYTAQIAAGVWVGFDKEKSLGKGEVGGRAALPIWVDYMKAVHEGLPQMTIPVPEGIVFANIDGETGKLATPHSKQIVKQAYIDGTEPTTTSQETDDTTEFLKRDLTE